MKCETCKFYDEYAPTLKDGEEPDKFVPDEGYGECKRFPPVLRRPLRDEEDGAKTSTTIRPVILWSQPFTMGTDGCGEWSRVTPNV